MSDAAGAWRLAAVEAEALACSACKRLDATSVVTNDDPATHKHTTCARLLRLARRFRGRAAPGETVRGPETSSRGVR